MKKILYLAYTNPAAYPPLHHSSRILADRGWQVFFLGIQALESGDIPIEPYPNVTFRKLKFCQTGFWKKFHYFWFALRGLALGIFWRPQWVYVSDPLACPAGLLLSGILPVRIIYHEHDSPPKIEGAEALLSRWMRFTLWTRKRLVRNACCCILPNKQRAEAFKEDLGRRAGILAVWNCPSRTEALLEHALAQEGALKLFYHGSISPHRLPLTILEAMAALPDLVKLHVVGYETVGTKGYGKRFQEKAAELGVDSCLEWRVGALLRREEMLNLCSQSDVGLSLMPVRSGDVNERTMAGASNKPFEYLSCGLALLVSDLPEWRRMFVKPGYGLACDPTDSGSILGALKQFLGKPGKRREMGEEGKQRILKEWNYEKQFAPVLDCIEKQDESA